MILKKRDIEFFWESVNPDFHMQISFSLCILLCSRFPFHTWTSPIIHLLCPLPPPPPPTILRRLCFQLSWVLQSSQGKLKTLLMQNWCGKTKCIKGDVQVANYVFWFARTVLMLSALNRLLPLSR